MNVVKKVRGQSSFAKPVNWGRIVPYVFFVFEVAMNAVTRIKGTILLCKSVKSEEDCPPQAFRSEVAMVVKQTVRGQSSLSKAVNWGRIVPHVWLLQATVSTHKH